MLTPAERTKLVTRAMEYEYAADTCVKQTLRADLTDAGRIVMRDSARRNYELAAMLYARATSQTTI